VDEPRVERDERDEFDELIDSYYIASAAELPSGIPRGRKKTRGSANEQEQRAAAREAKDHCGGRSRSIKIIVHQFIITDH
jgi:hypothetical protein